MYDADKIFDIIEKSKETTSRDDVVGYVMSVLLQNIDRRFDKNQKEFHSIAIVPMPTDRKWCSLRCMHATFNDFLLSKPKDVWDKLGIKKFEIEEMYTDQWLKHMMVTYNVEFK